MQISPWTRAPLLFLFAGPLLSACDSTDPVSPGDPVESHFAFEVDMEGWQAAATDTLDPLIDWHVEHTTQEAAVGEGSVEFHLANLNDAGKIWMERSFDLAPGTTYEVALDYAFATSDWGDFNLFTIIAGVHADPPRSAGELTFQGNTGHGGSSDVGLVWLEKSYTFTQTVPTDGAVYVTIGVWGTWETDRTYFVDEVTIRFTPIAQ
jgi:hypothetical protein